MNKILKLNQFDYLLAKRPRIKKFSEDEIEVWLITSSSKVRIFKDSLKYVIKMESAEVVNYVSTAPPLNIDEIINGYIERWTKGSSSVNYERHMLFDYSKSITWLTKSHIADDITIEIWDINPWTIPVFQRKLYGFQVPLSDFLTWWDKVVKFE